MLIACFVITILAGYVFNRIENFRDKGYIIFISVLLILLMGLRHETCFIDTVRYVGGYNLLKNASFSQIPNLMNKDSTFWIFSKLIGYISGYNYTIWLFILGAIYVIPIAILIRKYSLSSIYSYIVFWALGFCFFSMTGLRQTLAFSLIVVAFIFLMEKRPIMFISTVLVASLFHVTAAIFIIAYPITLAPLNKKTICLYAISALLLQVFGRSLLYILIQSNDRFIGYEDFHGANLSGLIIQILIFGYSLYYLQDELDLPINKTLFHMCLLGIVFQSVATHVAEMFRISMYFSIFNIVLFANAISSTYKDPTLSIIRPLTIVALCVYTLISPSTNTEYHFFWSTL